MATPDPDARPHCRSPGFLELGTAKPLLFGFLPVGLWYHAGFAVACAILMGLLVKFCWPTYLESAQPETPEARAAELGEGH